MSKVTTQRVGESRSRWWLSLLPLILMMLVAAGGQVTTAAARSSLEAAGAGVVPLTYTMPPTVSWYMAWRTTPVDGPCRSAADQEQEFRAQESFCSHSGGTPDELRGIIQPFGATSCIGSNVSSLDG